MTQTRMQRGTNVVRYTEYGMAETNIYTDREKEITTERNRKAD